MAKKENKTNKHFLKDFKAELKKVIWPTPDRKSTRLNSSHSQQSRMPSSA